MPKKTSPKDKENFLKLFTESHYSIRRTCKEINKKSPLKLSLREMSRHLTSFSDKGLTKCLNPGAPYNRSYFITEKGKKIRETI